MAGYFGNEGSCFEYSHRKKTELRLLDTTRMYPHVSHSPAIDVSLTAAS